MQNRKIINIFLSIIWFEKEVSFLQKLSLLFGFLVVILESFEKSFVGEKEKRKDIGFSRGREKEDKKNKNALLHTKTMYAPTCRLYSFGQKIAPQSFE